MGKENTCKIVPNTELPGKVRMACSKCGSIITDKKARYCPVCKRRIKPSDMSEFSH